MLSKMLDKLSELVARGKTSINIIEEDIDPDRFTIVQGSCGKTTTGKAYYEPDHDA